MNGQWSGAEQNILKFHDRKSAENVMKLMGFKKNTWLDGVVTEITEYKEYKEIK
jgi:hypothetical protein